MDVDLPTGRLDDDLSDIICNDIREAEVEDVYLTGTILF